MSNVQTNRWGGRLLGTDMCAPAQDSEALLKQAMKPSEEWIDVGSGGDGRVYLEVIAADDLPNTDCPNLADLNNKSDPFCCLVLEDAIVNTSIIRNCLSPRWMPSDRRAFVFHVHHPSSILYVGVWDYDNPNNPWEHIRAHVHDPLGRIIINLTQFTPNTIYTLYYNLYLMDFEAEKMREEKKHRGTILLRLRIEWNNNDKNKCTGNPTKNMLMAGMLPRKESFHVSVPTKYDFEAAYYTTVGDVSVST